MNWLLNTLFGWLRTPPRLTCAEKTWVEGVAELHRRTLSGRRESGAFLLGTKGRRGTVHIVEFVYYDDIDPRALERGYVHIHGAALPKLWEVCRERGYGVVADVHVHPGGYGQSDSDQENPVMPRAGHLALILPNFATGNPVPGRIGIYEFCGSGQWLDHSLKGRSFFRIGTGT